MNSVDVPDSDLMATNGVIHVVKNVLYPAGENVKIKSCNVHSAVGGNKLCSFDAVYYLQTFLWAARTSWSS